MEILGAVAATGQLIGTVLAILDSIDRLREFLKHAPGRFRGYSIQLTALGEVLSSIRQNSLLHTCPVRRIIEEMAPKISTLMELCSLYAPQSKLRLYARLNRALSAKKVEPRILQSFQSLETDKTTLILTITMIKKDIPIEHNHCTRQEESQPEQMRSANGISRGDTFESIEKDQTVDDPKQKDYSSTQVTPKQDSSINSHLTTMSHSPTQQNTRNIIFKKISNRGNRAAIGIASGSNTNDVAHSTEFHDINSNGDDATLGVYTLEAASRANASSASLNDNNVPLAGYQGSGVDDETAPPPSSYSNSPSLEGQFEDSRSRSSESTNQPLTIQNRQKPAGLLEYPSNTDTDHQFQTYHQPNTSYQLVADQRPRTHRGRLAGQPRGMNHSVSRDFEEDEEITDFQDHEPTRHPARWT